MFILLAFVCRSDKFTTESCRFVEYFRWWQINTHKYRREPPDIQQQPVSVTALHAGMAQCGFGHGTASDRSMMSSWVLWIEAGNLGPASELFHCV